MIKNKTSAHARTRQKGCAVIAAATLVLCGSLAAEVENELDELVVSAMRIPGDPSKATSALTIMDPEKLEKMGILNLRDALNRVPGVIATSTAGQTGAAGSVFIRGTVTSYSQLVVDGIRVSDATVPLGNFFSGARIDDLSRIEVLRGPQAAIHGGESVGGVIWLETARGEGDPKTKLRMEGGSFDSLNAFGSNSGTEGPLSWYVGGGYDGTHNDAARQNFDQTRASMRLEWAQRKDVTLGMTYRAVDSRFQYNSSGINTDHIDSQLVTTYANVKFSPSWDSRFVLGRYTESYDNDSSSNYGTDSERVVSSMDHQIEINDRHTLLTGGFVEHTDFKNTIGTKSDEYRYGGHLGWQWTPVDSFVGDAVMRWEDYADYDDQRTWRVGGSWQALEQTRLRSGIGKSFRTPTFLDLYGTRFGKGNANLKAEESLGWDLGVEQDLTDDHMVSVTYFQNQIENRIRSSPTPPVNLDGTTPTRGIEFAAQGDITDEVSYVIAWTWLSASLQDQPENTTNASLDWQATEKLSVGVGATYVDTRSYGASRLDDYMLLRIHGNYQLNEMITLNARVENIADQNYKLFSRSGRPVQGAGLGFFTGITATF